ncbi:pirin-like C-terminal cupin domain-containing protein [Pseudarthrobacter sp. B4EP4b]|uniref:pirin-like C-terminal cupin domain-containing protein n=1 Tax=Pseudarthrobacter sp. B4EP4b TaxID=2590664 RepID=UPI00351A4D7D
MVGVVQDPPVEDVGEASFECSTGLAGCFTFGGVLQVVVPAWPGVTALADGHGVQHGVELPVASCVELCRVLILGGVPLGEQIVLWWNFVGRSNDDIVSERIARQAEIGAEPAGPPGL